MRQVMAGSIGLLVACFLCGTTGEPVAAGEVQAGPSFREQARPDGLADLIVTQPDGRELARYTANLKDHHHPATEKTPLIARWESYRYGGFVCFNDNQFTGDEISRNKDPRLFNPTKLDVAGWVTAMKKAGMKYAVLTVRHTSGFLLWDSPTSAFDVGASPCKTDLVDAFVKECRRQGMAPGIYYCLWGHKKSVLPDENARPVILAQLHELASRYGEIPFFWIDMKNWAPGNLSAQEIYDLLRNLQPNTVVILNQHIQDGSKIAYFPTDVLNGEVMVPPAAGHQTIRELGGKKYYLPFEFEPVSQRRSQPQGTATPLGKVGVWFTYGEDGKFKPSTPIPVPVLFDWLKQAWDRGASNVLLSMAPDHTGAIRPADAAQLEELARKLREAKLIE